VIFVDEKSSPKYKVIMQKPAVKIWQAVEQAGQFGLMEVFSEK
jgi:hypothetical protein